VPLELDETPPDGVSLAALITSMETALAHGCRTHHRLFFNQLSARADCVGVAADWLISASHAPVHTYEVSPVLHLAERACLARLAAAVGPSWVAAPAEAGGATAQAGGHEGLFCPGGSAANLLGLLLARHARWPSSREEGLVGLPRGVVLCSEGAHYSVGKACATLGLGSGAAVAVRCDARGRVLPDCLATAAAEAVSNGSVVLAVVATAGTTVTGAFDDLRACRAVATAHGAWLHVDGCWGAAALLSSLPRRRALLDGVAEADSLSWSAHKMLGVPLQCSALLTRHPGRLRACNGSRASYLFQPDKLHTDQDLGDLGIGCSRRGDAFKLWAVWKARGDAGLAARVDRSFALCDVAERALGQHPGGRFVLAVPRRDDSGGAENDGNTAVATGTTGIGDSAAVCFWWMPTAVAVFVSHTRGASPLSSSPTPTRLLDVAALPPLHRALLDAAAPAIKRRLQARGGCMLSYQPLGDCSPFFRLVFPSPDSVSPTDIEAALDQIHAAGLEAEEAELLAMTMGGCDGG